MNKPQKKFEQGVIESDSTQRTIDFIATDPHQFDEFGSHYDVSNNGLKYYRIAVNLMYDFDEVLEWVKDQLKAKPDTTFKVWAMDPDKRRICFKTDDQKLVKKAGIYADASMVHKWDGDVSDYYIDVAPIYIFQFVLDEMRSWGGEKTTGT